MQTMSTQEMSSNEDNEELKNNYNNSNNSNTNSDSKLLEISLLLDRNYLIKLVDINHSKLSFVPQIGKSKAWTRFERIYYDDCKTVYVKCKYCDDIIKHCRPFGTGGLLRHKCLNYCKKRKGLLTADGQKQKQYFLLESENRLEDNSKSDNSGSADNCGAIEVKANFVIDRNFLANLVKARDERLTFVRHNGKSCVWHKFERIYYDNCETFYVKCRFCDDIQKHGRNFGTGSLLRHNCCQQCRHKSRH